MFTLSLEKLPFVDNTKLGDCVAQQPLSGIAVVTETSVMSQHGSFVRVTKAEPADKAAG
jgi:hypothetical protein